MTKMGFTQEDMSLINIAAFEGLVKRIDDDEDKSMDSLKRAQKMTLACLNRTARDTTYGGPMAATLVMGFDTHYASATSVLLTMDSFLRPAPQKIVDEGDDLDGEKDGVGGEPEELPFDETIVILTRFP